MTDMTEVEATDDETTDTPKHVGWFRPCIIDLEIIFADGNRKVTPADLERASAAAAAAARASLEGRYPAYKIEEIDVNVEYRYLMARKHFKG